MLLAEMPELGQMTAGEAAAMAGLAPVPHNSGAMRGRLVNHWRTTRNTTRPVPGRIAAACHNPVLKPVAKRLKERGQPHKVIAIAIARRLIIIANAILKTGGTWRPQAG